jgi:DNA polymerase III alpha subunit (gram-positive type)
MHTFCVLDIETGGLDKRIHALMSVGLVRLDGQLSVVEENYWLVYDPTMTITPQAVAVNGLSMNPQPPEATPVDEVLFAVQAQLDGAVMVNHNSPFDTGWLNFRAGLGIEKSIDTLWLSWRLFPKQPSKLGELAQRLGIEFDTKETHNSLVDANLTAQILLRMKERFGESVLEPAPIDFEYWNRRNAARVRSF